MSTNETPETEPASTVPEAANSEPEDSAISPRSCYAENTATSREDRNSSVQGVNSEISLCTDDEVYEEPTKEINVPFAGNEKTEAVNEPEIGNDNRIVEVKGDVQPTSIPEMQQQTSIGDGDANVVPRRDVKIEEVVESLVTANGQILSTGDKCSTETEKTENENLVAISKLKDEVRKTIAERESYRRQVEDMEKKMTVLQQAYDMLLKGDGDESMLHRMIEQLKAKLIQTTLELEDRIRTVTNQEKQISALNSQVASLKQVETLTRSLLQIRNMEVKHLQAEVDDMEVRINEERDRYNTMINKMDSAVKLNAELKKEYETQLGLFRDLREKYEEKVSLLSEEKRALEEVNTAPVTE